MKLKDVKKLRYHSKFIVNVCLDDNDAIYFKTPIVFRTNYISPIDGYWEQDKTCILENEI